MTLRRDRVLALAGAAVLLAFAGTLGAAEEESREGAKDEADEAPLVAGAVAALAAVSAMVGIVAVALRAR